MSGRRPTEGATTESLIRSVISSMVYLQARGIPAEPDALNVWRGTLFEALVLRENEPATAFTRNDVETTMLQALREFEPEKARPFLWQYYDAYVKSRTADPEVLSLLRHEIEALSVTLHEREKKRNERKAKREATQGVLPSRKQSTAAEDRSSGDDDRRSLRTSGDTSTASGTRARSGEAKGASREGQEAGADRSASAPRSAAQGELGIDPSVQSTTETSGEDR